MISEIHGDSAPALLRQVAKELEDGGDPSYFFCVVQGDDAIKSVFNSGRFVFTLAGIVSSCTARMLAFIDS